MSQALYRKWRPARFDEVVGQEHVTRTLQNAVAAGRIGHAYLFSGPRGTGKTTLARLLAKAANCLHEDPAERPCNVCAPCIAVGEGRFLDLIEIDAASNTGVDDIRDLREKINFSPSDGRFKVYIIDEVHMLSAAAFNALLKTLEEPPSHAIFVLATTEEHKVPLTIKSRCQQFNFRLLTHHEITGRLKWLAEQEELTVEQDALDLIAQNGAGSLRDAESLLDQLVVAPGDTINLERAQLILGTASSIVLTELTDAWLGGDGQAGLAVIHEALAAGADARQFSRQMVSYLRQLLLIQMGGKALPIDVVSEQLEIMQRQAAQANRLKIIEALKNFNNAATNRSENWQPHLPLELAFIESLPEDVRTPSQPAVEARSADDGPESAAADDPVSPSADSDLESSSSDLQPKTLTEQQIPVSSTVQREDPESESSSELLLEKVTATWPELREQVGHIDKNLPAFLASCKPLATEGEVLILGFDYPILKEKFDKRQMAAGTIADVLGEMLQTKITVRAVVTDQYSPAMPDSKIDAEEFAALAKELGGIVKES